ncbi:MAG TPA: hypothetical protein VK712_00155 [Verrucomicrobiae bacterium]|jgi:hypothetical protein|nr:hypothetical protein [Verrucomicrobiae bacterium]
MQPDQNQPQDQVSASSEPSSVQTSSPVGGGMKVIQPTDPNLSSAQNTEPQSQAPNPVVSTPPQDTNNGYISPPNNATPNPTAMHVDGQPVSFSANSQTLQEKRHLPWARIIKWSLLVIVLAAAGTVLATNQNIRATVFRQKFTTYNYPTCKTHVCTVKFYRGSKIGSYTPVTPPGQTPLKPETTLLSPVIGGKTYLAMLVGAYPLSFANTSAGKQLLDTYSTCSASGETSGFTVYVTDLDANANVCAIPGNIGTNNSVIGYVTAFASQKAGGVFLISINENFSINSQGQATTPIFNLADYQNDMQTVFGSLSVSNK